MRKEKFASDEFYFVSGYGARREKIFIDDSDHARFVFLLTHFQSPIRIYNVSWYTSMFLKKGSLSTGEGRIDGIVKDRNIELVAFAVMPDHFHIVVQNLENYILSVYMQRVLTAYGKYFNAKYNKKGHVFEGPFVAAHIRTRSDLAERSAYIHKNPKEIPEWSENYEKYPWSSYQDYIGLNRWGNLISRDPILKQFKDQNKYKEFVIASKVKEPSI